MEYEFSSTANNGQITAMTQRDGVGATVQRVAYTYDSLARLQNAQTTAGSVSWNLSFGMDGFGNLNSQTGSNAPNWSQPTNPQNNRLYTFGYDANGNTTSAPGTTLYDYDVENRLTKTTLPGGGGFEEYGYGTGNQRVWRRRAGTGEYEIYFYKVSGERFGKYRVGSLNDGSGNIGFFLLEQEEAVPSSLRYNRDRLGNAMYTANTVYFPYGEERTATVNDRDKFGTYHRDGPTGLDYANNRYYSMQSARFLTADPYRASGRSNDPVSWNRYAYVNGDSVNNADPTGLDVHLPPECYFFQPLGYTCTHRFIDNQRVGWQATATNVTLGQAQLDAKALAFGNKAVDMAIIELNRSAQCAAIFSTTEGRATDTWNPARFLRRLYGRTLQSVSTFTGVGYYTGGMGYLPPGDSAAARTLNVVFTPPFIRIPIVISVVVIDRAALLFNGGLEAHSENAHILIHEMGHVYDAMTILGSGGSLISTFPENQAGNANLIHQRCNL